jgi:hypothetical protein
MTYYEENDDNSSESIDRLIEVMRQPFLLTVPALLISLYYKWRAKRILKNVNKVKDGE